MRIKFKNEIGKSLVVLACVVGVAGIMNVKSINEYVKEHMKEAKIEKSNTGEILEEDIIEHTDEYILVNAEALQYDTDYTFEEIDEKTIVLKSEDNEMKFVVGEKTAQYNRKKIKLNAKTQKIEDVYAIELQTTADTLGYEVTTTNISDTLDKVYITKKTKQDKKIEKQIKTEKTVRYSKFDEVNVRSGADTLYKVLGKLEQNEEVTKIGEQGSWDIIEYKGKNGYVKTEYLSDTKVEEKEESQPKENGDGVYTKNDKNAVVRFQECEKLLAKGLQGDMMMNTETFINYYGSIYITNSTTDDTWMYMSIDNWSDTYDGDSKEEQETYNEIPSLVKKCLKTIAPEGGTELYDSIVDLINEYGSIYDIPDQGKIKENIPGLFVTVVKGRDGLEINFFPEKIDE